MRHFFLTAFFVPTIMLFTISCERVICIPSNKAEVTDNPMDNWIPTVSPTTNNLLDVTFINSTTGFISGASGTLLKTTDGGVTWNAMSTGIAAQIRSICMIDPNNGFLATDNGQIFKTTDAGISWQSVKTIEGNPTLNKIYFVNQTTGFVGGLAGTFLRTIDGGITWDYIDSGSTSSIYYMDFVDSHIGYICGQANYMAKTTDGGLTWTPQDSRLGSNIPADLLLNIQFADADHGFAIGEKIYGLDVYDTYILYTKDGGQHWERCVYPFKNLTLSGLIVTGPNTAYVSGGEVHGNTHTIFKTTDGKHWEAIKTGPKRSSAMFLNGSTGFCVGLNGLIMRGE